MLLPIFLQLAPGDCILTGLCGTHPVDPGLPSGVRFLAVGLVLAGAIGLARERRRHCPLPTAH
jgi:MYXO-CTERM domain-containing protein